MPQPPLKHFESVEEYREYFHRTYCCGPIQTFDGIDVFFRKTDFAHCMYESTTRSAIKDEFSRERAERIDWIAATLLSPNADLFVGWDKKRKCADPNRRVAVVWEDYVVIIRVSMRNGTRVAGFVTAYVADSSIGRIRGMARWTG